MTVIADGYWCTVTARTVPSGDVWILGDYRAPAPHLAVRWLRARAGRLADALDPNPDTCAFPRAALHRVDPGVSSPGDVFRAWMGDFRYQGKQLHVLAAGWPISVSVRAWDRILGWGDTEVLYSLSARPVWVELPPAELEPGAATSLVT